MPRPYIDYETHHQDAGAETDDRFDERTAVEALPVATDRNHLLKETLEEHTIDPVLAWADYATEDGRTIRDYLPQDARRRIRFQYVPHDHEAVAADYPHWMSVGQAPEGLTTEDYTLLLNGRLRQERLRAAIPTHLERDPALVRELAEWAGAVIVMTTAHEAATVRVAAELARGYEQLVLFPKRHRLTRTEAVARLSEALAAAWKELDEHIAEAGIEAFRDGTDLRYAGERNVVATATTAWLEERKRRQHERAVGAALSSTAERDR